MLAHSAKQYAHSNKAWRSGRIAGAVTRVRWDVGDGSSLRARRRATGAVILEAVAGSTRLTFDVRYAEAARHARSVQITTFTTRGFPPIEKLSAELVFSWIDRSIVVRNRAGQSQRRRLHGVGLAIPVFLKSSPL